MRKVEIEYLTEKKIRKSHVNVIEIVIVTEIEIVDVTVTQK